MRLFNIFGQDNNSNDPYWDFEKSDHFKPKLNKGDFFKLTAFDFGWFVLQPLSKMVKDRENEIERGKRLSYGQKALYYWWYVDGQVTNGGFVQFYYNGYERYVPAIIKGLEYIGDREMASLIRKADKIYQKKKKLVDKAKEKDLFDGDLYDRLGELSELDHNYYDLNKSTMAKIEEFARKNPNEFCVDEDGKDLDTKFSGECKTFFPDGHVKDIFQLKNGIVTGEYRTYFENGNLQQLLVYKDGKQTGEQEEFFEDGKTKFKSTLDTSNAVFKHQWFFENGNPKKLEYKALKQDEQTGEYKRWYENGQLEESGTYSSDQEREGPLLKFYENGSKKLEAEFKNGKLQVQNYWNEKGEQLLKDGTGLYINEYSIIETISRNEQQYKNYQRHGTSKTFEDGRLTLSQEFQNGVQHGMTRSYYDNGSVSEETIYENGKKVSQTKFDKFKNAFIKTTILCEMKDEWLTNQELETADVYPVPLNAEELARDFKVDKSFFEGYPQDRELGYKYFVTVDDTGNVIDMSFSSASNGRITDDVEANILKLKFKPAMKGTKTVTSYVDVRYRFKFADREE